MKASAIKADPGKGSKSAGKDARHNIRNRTGPLNETGPLMDLIQGLNWGGERPSMERLAGELASMPLARRQKAVLSMQRTRGNSFVQRLAIQAKLKVGPAGDKYEQEADRVADRVMRMTEQSNPVQRQEDEEEIQTKPLAASITPLVQRFTSFITSTLQRQGEEEEIQTKSAQAAGSFEAGSAFESQISATRGGGQTLPDGIRQPMERAFGADFGGVRVHADGEADSLNRLIQARAFTTGQDIFLRQGEYRPGTSEGQRLLAHELTHVMQQNDEVVQRWPEIKSKSGKFKYELGFQFERKHIAKTKEEAISKAKRLYDPNHKGDSHSAYVTVIYGGAIENVEDADDVNPKDQYEWSLSVQVEGKAVCMEPSGRHGADGDPGRMADNIQNVILSGYIIKGNVGLVTHVSVSQ